VRRSATARPRWCRPPGITGCPGRSQWPRSPPTPPRYCRTNRTRSRSWASTRPAAAGHGFANLSPRRFAKLWNTLVDLGDPGYQILAAYIAKEELRELLALARTGPDRYRTAQRPYDFSHWCARSDQPELERLATTTERWRPHVEAFLHTKITNAGSEGINRLVKLTARNAYGFTNPANQRLRVRCLTTRKTPGHLKPA
jgi:transposase